MRLRKYRPNIKRSVDRKQKRSFHWLKQLRRFAEILKTTTHKRKVTANVICFPLQEFVSNTYTHWLSIERLIELIAHSNFSHNFTYSRSRRAESGGCRSTERAPCFVSEWNVVELESIISQWSVKRMGNDNNDLQTHEALYWRSEIQFKKQQRSDNGNRLSWSEVNGLLSETHREGNLQLFDVTETEVEEDEGNRAGMLTLS